MSSSPYREPGEVLSDREPSLAELRRRAAQLKREAVALKVKRDVALLIVWLTCCSSATISCLRQSEAEK